MARFRLDLCGDFRLARQGGRPVPLAGRKTQALLAYLALPAGRAHSREHLATLLWGERMDEQARQSLRQALSALRKSLGRDGALRTDGDGVALDADAFSTDVAEIDALADDGTPEALDRAANLAAEPLLRGFTTGEDGFDRWLAGERERLRGTGCAALERLATHHAEQGDRSAAIAAARRLVALDPLRESGHRQLMRLYAESGRRAEALRQYQACAEALRRELDAEPDGETQRLHDEIRGGTVGATETKLPPSPPGLSLPPLDAPLTFGEPPPVPDIPSLAVLPFENLSGDPEQTYFSDGITEDIIVDLSHISGMLVISRHASFAYRGKAVALAQIGRELGVRSILEGTVRRSGDRIRITVQLLEAATGRPLWAERYDRELADLFQVQDEITSAIVTELSVKLLTGERGRSWRTAFRDPAALEWFYQGVQQFHLNTDASLRQAVDSFQDVLQREPESVIAQSYLAFANIRAFALGLADAPAAWEAAVEALERARHLDPEHPQVLALAATIHMFWKEYDEALEASALAVDMAPNSEEAWTVRGFVCTYSGQPEEGLEALLRARRMRPVDWPLPLAFLSATLRDLGRLDDSITTSKRCLELFPDFLWAYHDLAVAFGLMGRWAEAKEAVRSFLRVSPSATIGSLSRVLLYRDQAYLEQLQGILRRAGLPD